MINIGDRQSGTLNGRLIEIGEVHPEEVTVNVAAGSAGIVSVQHTAWMTCNLLARLTPTISRICVDIDGAATLHPNVIPNCNGGGSFRELLVKSINAFGLIPADVGKGSGTRIFVGPGSEPGLRAFGCGWTGGITYNGASAITDAKAFDLPFGPYLAACFVAAELFRMFRLPDYEPSKTVFYDGWKLEACDNFNMSGPALSPVIDLPPISLAGAGAVGNAWLHALWATPQIRLSCDVADPDPEGIEGSNLNRYCLFGVNDIGKKKASAASEILERRDFTLHPFDGRFEDLSREHDVIVCAVDTEQSRANVQARYRPIMLMGSTLNLRAEVLRTTAPGINACLRCYNEPPKGRGDDDLRQEMQRLSEGDLHRLAEEAGISPQEADEYVSRGKCGEPSERLLSAIRKAKSEQGARFAIGFVSVASGVILASETAKLALGSTCALNADINRAVLQFMTPSNNLPASRIARNASCPMCAPGKALAIWQRRFAEHPANR